MSRLADAAAALGRGEVVAIPTDTVYGLAVNPLIAGAVESLFRVKRRPRSASIPVLVADVAQARNVGVLGVGESVVHRFWPGGLTVVVRRTSAWQGVDLGEELDTVALRVPDHLLARQLCEMVGPLAVTSANEHGGQAAWAAADIDISGVALVLDGGPGAGAASTIVDFTGPTPRQVRPGPVDFEAVLAELAATRRRVDDQGP